MAEKEKVVKYDIDGFEAITPAIRSLLNEYPGLSDGDEIAFATLADDKGKAMFPVSGASIETVKTSVTGRVVQICLYPFFIIYRGSGLSESRKAAVKEWLDDLGKWLEKQPITVKGETCTITDYPELTGNRTILEIKRTSPAYLESVEANKAENWAISISVRYRNVYQK
uniref:Minor capsid protein from bacteriophage n=1 Tax=Siphoviridae sp. ctOyJ30 TaxID=2826317 RepID=A0A8S5NDL9_9CAUD|nr:MAG TPA: Minor capsid protein from bacteriophage [Siphoviridae sp. ctOyJ30]